MYSGTAAKEQATGDVRTWRSRLLRVETMHGWHGKNAAVFWIAYQQQGNA